MMAQSKHMPGPSRWEARYNNDGSVHSYVVLGHHQYTAAPIVIATSYDEANARLIAEAFTVAHETGRTPRQLARQRAELLATLKELADASRSYIGYMDADDVDVLERARAAIAKAEGAAKPFYGAECPSYPNCNGGCGLGCTHEIEAAKAEGGAA